MQRLPWMISAPSRDEREEIKVERSGEEKVIIISATDSFLAKSLLSKLEGENVEAAWKW